MKKLLILAVFILLIPAACALEQDYDNYSYLDIGFTFENKLSVESVGVNSEVENIEVIITTFPKSNQLQEISEFNIATTPVAQSSTNEKELKVNWNKPVGDQFKITITSDIKSINAIANIDSKVPFPISLTQYKEYALPGANIDINSDIRKQAQALAAGKDDLYAVSFSLSKWVYDNVEYNATVVPVELIKKSSWVMENRKGVCDEMTNLFISMMRSLDIPTKFVTGLAYSNIKGEWEPHAWAEVYFPGHGWIAYDITYGQYGWIDPTHIKLSESIDSGVPSSTYKWKAFNTQLNLEETVVEAKLKGKGEAIPQLVALKVNPLIKKAGPGSYIPIEITIKNGQNIYLTENLMLTKAPEINSQTYEQIFLKPKETKKIYWLLRAPVDLEPGFTYTSEIGVEDRFHTEDVENITFASNYKFYSEEAAQSIIENLGEEVESSKYIDLSCESVDYVYIYDSAQIKCKIKNKIDSELKGVKLCTSGSCKKVDVKTEKELEIGITPENLGLASHVLVASYLTDIVEEIETFSVLETPGMRFVDMKIPEVIDYKKDTNLTFILVAEAPVTDVLIFVNDGEIMSFPYMENSKKVVIKFNGEGIYPKEEILVTASYKDENGKEYKTKEKKDIKIKSLPWYMPILKVFGLV